MLSVDQRDELHLDARTFFHVYANESISPIIEDPPVNVRQRTTIKHFILFISL